MQIHKLKSWPDSLFAVMGGQKTYELRRHDREYEVGDLLHLVYWTPNPQEWGAQGFKPDDYAAAFGDDKWGWGETEVLVRVLRVDPGPGFGLPADLVLLSICRASIELIAPKTPPEAF